MKRKTILLYVLIICVLFPLRVFALTGQTPESETIKRLAGLCRLWGYVKYFHPSLAYRADIDWDAALVQVIPKVREAKSAAEYAAALQTMLDALGDPLTKVESGAARDAIETQDKGKQFEAQVTPEGVLIIVAGNYYELSSPETQQKLKSAAAELPKARALVLDLRSSTPPDFYGNLQMTGNFNQIERLLSTTPMPVSGKRKRIYYGFETDSLFSSGQYKSGFFVQNGSKIMPARNARNVSCVFILNKNSAVLPSILALQASGKGQVIFEGDAKDSATGEIDMLELGEGVRASVRVSEAVYVDGASGDIQPNFVVAPSGDRSNPALDAALNLANNFVPSAINRKQLPGAGIPAFDNSYSDKEYPALEYRLLGVFRIWNIVNYFHPYKHLIGEDWDSVLRDFIPRVESAPDALEYTLAIAEMVTHLHDSHAYIAGTVFSKQVLGDGYPPVRVRIIENTPVVTYLYDEAAAKAAGIEVGDIIVKVDGEDAKALLARYSKYISTSTPQSAADKASLSFMNGQEDSIVTLTVRGRDDKERQVKLKRHYENYTTLYNRERRGEIVKMLPGNIGYVDLDRLPIDMVDSMFEQFKNTRGIIFDMRGYPTDAWFLLPPRLNDSKQEVPAALFDTPMVSYDSPPHSSNSFYQTVSTPPPDKPVYKGKTVMLIDERTMSRAEHLGLLFRAANGTRFIGTATSGADGELTNFSVPGGITIGFTGQSVRFPDGRQLQRIGLIPDLEIKQTINGIRAGRDEVLEKAMEFIYKGR